MTIPFELGKCQEVVAIATKIQFTAAELEISMTSEKLPEFDLEMYLPYRVTVAAGRISDALARHYKSKFGISIPEWRVLINVGYTENPSIRDIEHRVKLEKSKVSRAASRLEAKGLITKMVDPSDRRLVKLNLTPAGVSLLTELVPIAQAFQNKLDETLGKSVNDLHSALDKILESEE